MVNDVFVVSSDRGLRIMKEMLYTYGPYIYFRDAELYHSTIQNFEVRITSYEDYACIDLSNGYQGLAFSISAEVKEKALKIMEELTFSRQDAPDNLSHRLVEIIKGQKDV